MRIERLVTMANDIATYFAVEPDHATAVNGVRDHLRRFWEPGMRRQLKEHSLAHDGEGLLPLAREAVDALEMPRNDAA
ncbi:MAG TPA: formate dehydrogenase subunit delta [Dyella sp.]|uniref:formate dehydrogenase subunit delta n=1 Tax=Dyella sp. TaxID=1869338 RepID=UPI002D79FB66|nr:formate dehydrogenase subunit delta [Dyella sp.]HET6552690.1 formate dehydrogenase subunit delta [Dyella sp.]